MNIITLYIFNLLTNNILTKNLIMKNLLYILFGLTSSLISAQDALNYSSQLELIKDIVIIDGAKLNPKGRFINLKTDEMILTDRSAITLVNCVVKVNGLVDASANCKIKLVNSYIICKDYKGPRSKNIIKTDWIKNCKLNQMKYLKKMKGNPQIEIINKEGRIVIKGYKENISTKIIDTGVYDVRSKGNFYDSNVLLVSY